MEIRAILQHVNQRSQYKRNYPTPLGIVALIEEGNRYLADRCEWEKNAAPPPANPHSRHDPEAEKVRAYHEAKRLERLAAQPKPDRSPMETLRVHAQPLITAKRKFLGGAARLYFLFKNIDAVGAGWMEEKTLTQAAASLGVSRGSIRRWLADAKAAGFLLYFYDNQGRHVLKAASYAELYTILEIPFIDRQAVNVPAAALFSDGWYALVWEAWNAANVNGKVISQDTKQRLSGVPVATQRRLDKAAKIKRVRNYVITETPATSKAVAEFTNNGKELPRELNALKGKRGIFSINNFLAYCIPSISVVDSFGRAQPIGSRRLHRRSALVRSCFPAGAGDVEKRRIFCMSERQAERVRENGREAYEYVKSYNGFSVWKPV